MILTTSAQYEVPINSWVAKASGDLVCPICEHFVRNVKEVYYYNDHPVVFVDSDRGPTRVMSTRWYLTEDLGLVCSPECLEMHNTLGGGIYETV